MIIIGNETLNVSIATLGAELQSIYNKQTGLEYLWDANPAFWPRRSPVLFPVVGGIKNGGYDYKGKTYHFNRHGFAKEMEFSVENKSDISATFVLKTSDASLKMYPFYFKFFIVYSVKGNELEVKYVVENKGTELMYFSVGAHPAFKVPLTPNEKYDDYYLSFNEEEKAGIYPIAADGLILNSSVPCLEDTNELPLTKELFYNDALIFKNLKSTSISILNKNNSNGLTVSYEGMPYMGIWSFKNADFVCIEPWCGLGDTETSTGNIVDKEGINCLKEAEAFIISWKVALF